MDLPKTQAALALTLALALFAEAAVPVAHAAYGRKKKTKSGSESSSEQSLQDKPLWLVLPTYVGDPNEEAWRSVGQTGEALAALGLNVMSRSKAYQAFAVRHSAEPQPFFKEDIANLREFDDQTVRLVAEGRYAIALAKVRQALDTYVHSLTQINRRTQASTHLLNICLYGVRAHLREEDEEKARDLMAECMRLVPNHAIDERQHPPAVHKLAKEMKREYRNVSGASLRVRSKPSGCELRLNGRRMGTTPFEKRGLAPGKYFLEVACDGFPPPYRVHPLVLAGNRVNTFEEVTVDAKLEYHLGKGRSLSLVYPSRDIEEARRFRDALAIANIMGAAHVVLETHLGGNTARLDLVSVAQAEVVASAKLRIVDEEFPYNVEQVLEDMRAGQSRDYTQAGSPKAMSPWRPGRGVDLSARSAPAPEPKATRSRRPWYHIAGPIALSAASAGLLAAGIVAFARDGRADGQPQIIDGTLIADVYTTRTEGIAYTAASGAALAGALTWALLTRPSKKKRTPSTTKKHGPQDTHSARSKHARSKHARSRATTAPHLTALPSFSRRGAMLTLTGDLP